MNARPRRRRTPEVQAAPALGERIVFECPACDHEADARYKLDRDGIPRWQVGNSFSDRCPKGSECLRLLAEATGAKPYQLLEHPRSFVPTLEGVSRPSDLAPETPRSDQAWGEAVRELRRSSRALNARRYLRLRGIDPHQDDLGHTFHHGYEAVVARMYCGGEIVSEAFRYYATKPRNKKGEPIKNTVLRSRRVGWIGGTPLGGEGPLVLCAGFLDGILARQKGLAAVSTPGQSLPAELLPDLAGCSVSVTYDVGEEEAAARTVAKLRAAGIDAWVVRLAKLGLPEKGDVSDCLSRNNSLPGLLELIEAERRAAR